MITRRAVSIALAFALAIPGPARAQATAESDPIAEARERTARALVLFDEGRYDSALAELERAYRIAPNARVLYNLGRVHALRGDPVRALDALERCLAEGGAEISDARRREVEALAAEQRARIGTVRILVELATEAPIEVQIDGEAVPGDPALRERTVPVAVGRHRVVARAPHHQLAEEVIEIAGGTEREVVLRLAPIALATLRIRSTIPDVEVRLDGEVVGRTPFASSLSITPGRHRLEARRPGYRTTSEELELAPGSETERELQLRRDREAHAELGRLEVRLPRGSWRLELDGETEPAPSIEAPRGRHQLRVEVAEREPITLEVEIAAGVSSTVTPVLAWTLDARARRRGDAAALRTGGWASLGAGIALAAAGAAMLAVSQVEIDRRIAADAGYRVADSSPECRAMAGCHGMYETLIDENNDALGNWEIARIGSASGLGLGAAALIAGAILVLAAPSEEAIERDASASFALGPGSIAIAGRW